MISDVSPAARRCERVLSVAPCSTPGHRLGRLRDAGPIGLPIRSARRAAIYPLPTGATPVDSSHGRAGLLPRSNSLLVLLDQRQAARVRGADTDLPCVRRSTRVNRRHLRTLRAHRRGATVARRHRVTAVGS